MKIKWERGSRNDLFAEFKCTCPSPRWIGTEIEHLMNKKFLLSGYADSNFFHNVNKEPRPIKCNCGKEYTQQWFTDGTVEILEVN